jgi:glycolate oxidase iron-sulfur subunit
MQTDIAPEFASTPEGIEADAILRKCVHCGFCTATCPTYQLLGDELDGPRGRIYLMKQVLEGHAPTRSTQIHLDRCLTCRNCETTCPSGVRYGNLVEIGRRLVDERVPRPAGERVLRWALKEGLTSPLFKPALKLGQAVRPLLPEALRARVPPPAPASAHRWPAREHPRKVLLLMGCVQPAMLPNINSATARVLDAAGIQTLVAAEAGCCGAIRLHLGDHDGGLAHMRRNIDAWWPLVATGAVEAIVMNASGCGVTVKEYGHSLRHDPAYAEKARRVADLTRDLSELLPDIVGVLKERLTLPRSAGVRGGGAVLSPAGTPAGGAQRSLSPARRVGRLAFHPPCTLQHGQQLRGGVETHLRELGFDIQVATNEAHLCCGSAGTYSLLQPELALPLRDRKLGHLAALEPEAIVSANIGCIQHLQSGTTTPVRHWVEVLDEQLATSPP